MAVVAKYAEVANDPPLWVKETGGLNLETSPLPVRAVKWVFNMIKYLL
jgi:hypothetical protein